MSEARDERIVATRQRWATQGFGILFIALAVDLMVRSLVLRQDPRQYIDIWLIWMATVTYVSIGTTASGVEPYGGRCSKTWLVILIIAIAAGMSALLPLLRLELTLAQLLLVIVVGGAAACAGAFLSVRLVRGVYRAWEARALGRGPTEE